MPRKPSNELAASMQATPLVPLNYDKIKLDLHSLKDKCIDPLHVHCVTHHQECRAVDAGAALAAGACATRCRHASPLPCLTLLLSGLPRSQVFTAYINHDILSLSPGCKTVRSVHAMRLHHPWQPSALLLFDSPSEHVREYASRMFNTLSSLARGRDYLLQVRRNAGCQ